MSCIVFNSTVLCTKSFAAVYYYMHTIIDRGTALCAQYSRIKNNAVHNLSSYISSDNEKVVLSLGLKFYYIAVCTYLLYVQYSSILIR